MQKWWRRIRYLLGQRRFEADLGEEIDFHRTLTQRALETTGLDTAQAAAATRRTLGSVPLAQDQARDVWVWPWLQSLLQDLRFALRLLVKDRGFTAVAVLALAVGIGVNTTVFTFVNAVLLRGLPTDHPERIMYVATRDARMRSGGASYLDFRDWQASTQAFEGLAAFQTSMMNVGDEGRALERVAAAFVSANTFRLVGGTPVLGRDFMSDDDRPGAPAVVILGGALWKGRYGGDPAIVGRTIAIDRVPSVVIGIMPDGFKFPFNAELWQPLARVPGLATQPREARGLAVVGRLAAGVSLARAQADLGTIGARLAKDHPDTNRGVEPRVTTYNERFNGGFRLALLTMLGAVGVLLVIACANVANLLLARSARRAREIAVRVSLGATRWRIVRQLIVESLVLATLGGLFGFALSLVGVRLFARAVDGFIKPYWIVWTMDGRVFGFLALVCLGTAVVFGLAPALHLARTNVDSMLKEGGRMGSGGIRVRRWTSVLVTAEVALTLIVLASAGFMVRSFLVLYRADGVIDTKDLVMARVTLPEAAYPSSSQRMAFAARLEERLGAGPGEAGQTGERATDRASPRVGERASQGVGERASDRARDSGGERVGARRAIASATLTNALPFTPVGVTVRQFEIDGRAPGAGEGLSTVATLTAGDGYFDTLGLRLVRGRTFLPQDGTPGQERAIVNQRFAARHFPSGDPIGQRIRLSDLPTGPARPGASGASGGASGAGSRARAGSGAGGGTAGGAGSAVSAGGVSGVGRAGGAGGAGAGAAGVAGGARVVAGGGASGAAGAASASPSAALSPWLTIVGVAPTVRQTLDSPDAVVYLPYRSEPASVITMLARGTPDTAAEPSSVIAALVAQLRDEVRAIDPDLAIHTVMPMKSVLAQSRWRYQVFGVMFALFAGVALVLSAVGLYAVTAYAVTQRTQEIGLRMALGAGAAQVWWLVLRRALAQLGIGFAIGLAGAFGVGRLLQSMLVDTGTRDPVTLLSIAVLLVAVSLAACAWPARRAMRLDPVAALRAE